MTFIFRKKSLQITRLSGYQIFTNIPISYNQIHLNILRHNVHNTLSKKYEGEKSIHLNFDK
jgi:hypothetical protein